MRLEEKSPKWWFAQKRFRSKYRLFCTFPSTRSNSNALVTFWWFALLFRENWSQVLNQQSIQFRHVYLKCSLHTARISILKSNNCSDLRNIASVVPSYKHSSKCFILSWTSKTWDYLVAVVSTICKFVRIHFFVSVILNNVYCFCLQKQWHGRM